MHHCQSLSLSVPGSLGLVSGGLSSQLLEQTMPLGAHEGGPGGGPTPSRTEFAAQRRHLQGLVVSLDAALGSLLVPAAGATTPRSKLSRRKTPAVASGRGGSGNAGRDPSADLSLGRDDGADAERVAHVSPESAAALAAEALAAVKAALALPQHEHENDPPSASNAGGGGGGGGGGGISDGSHGNSGARELRVALARAIGALRNACVGAASSTAELLGGEDPTGFAQARVSFVLRQQCSFLAVVSYTV